MEKRMAQKEKSTKKMRTSKTSAHQHGGGGKLNRPMTNLEKILMGRPLPKGLRPNLDNQRSAPGRRKGR
jgi:hypothetical protein